jgi:hypothetical protein
VVQVPPADGWVVGHAGGGVTQTQALAAPWRLHAQVVLP